MIAAFVSYGNDSIALLQWLRDNNRTEVTAAYSETGWGADWWEERVKLGEAWAQEVGFATARIPSVGFVPLAKLKKAFPRNGMQFCTSELKIKPAIVWLDAVDPGQEWTCAVGVRRAESAARAQWPEWTEDSDKHGGRSLWAPLARLTDEERNSLITRAGFPILAHRSSECFPCVNSSRRDLRLLTPGRVDEIEAIEAEVGHNLFRPNKFMGARGIREIKRWADAERGKYEPPDDEGSGGCDSGMCGT